MTQMREEPCAPCTSVYRGVEIVACWPRRLCRRAALSQPRWRRPARHLAIEIAARKLSCHFLFTSNCCQKMVGIGCQETFRSAMAHQGEVHAMSVVQETLQTSPLSAAAQASSSPVTDDPVSRGLRESARRMIGIAVFSGVINLLMLSGSLYMLQVYDRVIPSRNIATLFGLSLMVLFAYLMQGYFDALRARMLSRVATLFDAGLQDSIHNALATLPLRGVRPMLMQQPLRDLDTVRAFMSSMGPTAFLDMPWIPIFLIGLFLFHPMIGLTALAGMIAIVAVTLATDRLSRGSAKSDRWPASRRRRSE